MELLEEGNLIDRVRILVQRDADFYQEHQRVLQENICPHVVGGLLDFPHYASFAAVKLATWWEAEYFNTFHVGSGLLEDPVDTNNVTDEGSEPVAKRVVTPTELESWVRDTAAMLLQHLHKISQEALDHADLTVLTGALGASALIKNWLWAYNTELRSRPETKISFQHSYQQYVEMSEALAERLLDLHTRLLSLYVLQDASALNWEASNSFAEGERGSYPIQMWWLYMQGTRDDLWKTVPPKMAQRVLSGMLNESLVILAARYSKASASYNRSIQLVTDLANILLCVAELLPHLYMDANILLKGGNEKALRDIHAKCHQLFIALIFRGAPLSIIYQVFRKGMIGLRMFDTPSSDDLPAWLQFTNHWLYTSGRTLPLHLAMLYSQPQPVWPLLIKVLLQENYMVSKILINELLPYLQSIRSISEKSGINCGGFLCPQSGYCDSESRYSHSDAAYALTYVLMTCFPDTNTIAKLFIEQGIKLGGEGWAHYLDRREIWTLKRPVWLTALLEPLFEILQPLVDLLLKEIKDHKRNLEELTGLTLSGLASLAPCVPPWLPRAWRALEDNIPADAEPLAGSVAFHCIIAALHSQLTLSEADALAEALCGLHSYSDSAIKQVLNMLPSSDIESEVGASSSLEVDFDAEIISSYVLENSIGRHALKVLWQWVQHNYNWLQKKLGAPVEYVLEVEKPLCPPVAARPEPNSILYTMFHIGTRPFDELLTDSQKPDWLSMLNLPLGLTPRQMWAHLSERSEWRSQNLNHHDATVVSAVTLCYHSLH